jgi:hypothetical protein
MSTTVLPINPDKFVIPHTVTPGSPSQIALQMGIARNEHQNALVQVGKGKVGGGLKNKKHKKSKKYRKSSMKKRFSKKFRKSIMRQKQSKVRKLSFRNKNKKALHGGAVNTWTIPSFSQTSPGGTSIINKLASNNAQTLAYSQYDSQVGKAS